jgi:two-component sensor histidine kinase
MSQDTLSQRVRALELDNARLRRLLQHEGMTSGLRHQVRNTLAMVRDVVRQSAERFGNVEDYAAHLEDRLDAIFRIQNTIANRPLDGVDLGVLITDELLAHAVSEGEQLFVSGEEVLLAPASSGLLALAIHELTTNAIKFGALSTAEGRLAVSWTVATVEEGGRPTLALVWVESGGDHIPPRPLQRGFGSEVIENALRHQLGGEGKLDFAPEGLRCTIRLPLTPTLGSVGHRPREL